MQTIILYLTASIISIFFLMLATKSKNNDKNELSNRRTKKITASTICVVISFLPLILLIALRDSSVGTDYKNYINAYLLVISENSGFNNSVFEGGFILIYKIFGLIAGQRYIFVFAFIGFLTLYFIYKGILENSKIPWLSLFLFLSTCLYYQTFNQFRQMLAIAIIFYAIKYIKARDLKKYSIFVLMATTIHTSSIVMLPVYFFVGLKVNFKNIFIYIVCLVVLMFNTEFIELLILKTPYSVYLTSVYNIEGSQNVILNSIVRMVLLAGSLLFSKKMIAVDKDNKYLYNIAILCTLFQFLAMYSSLFGRITTYLFIFYILLIPEIVYTIFKNIKQRTLVIFTILIGFTLYHFIYYNSPTAISSGYGDYHFVDIKN